LNTYLSCPLLCFENYYRAEHKARGMRGRGYSGERRRLFGEKVAKPRFHNETSVQDDQDDDDTMIMTVDMPITIRPITQ